jgi:glutaredoxin
MEVILYSTGCPNCKLLEAKLKQNNIAYQKVDDIDIMEQKGFMAVPMLEIGDKTMNFTQANTWINERKAQ